MIDESAFGLLIAYYGIENDEYAGEPEDFVERYTGFASAWRERLTQASPAASGRALDLGHALYVELLEGEEAGDPISWLRATRALLAERGFESAGVLTFGATWVDAPGARPELTQAGNLVLLHASLPSEPFRRALLAEAATHGDEDAGIEGWGPGLYLDVDAVEALGRKPKNTPTVLRAGGAQFYRGGS
jgi:hypothetical protein